MEKYQTLKARAIAFITDFFIVGLAVWAIVFFSGVARPTPKAVRIIIGVSGFLAVFYYIVMHARSGQTLGKKAARIKVLDESERPLNFGQSVLRSLPQLIPMMFVASISTAGASADRNSIIDWTVLIFGLAGIFTVADSVICLRSEKHRALHDKIAGTVVVRTDT